MTKLEDLRRRWPWRPIPGCPGRFTLPKSTLAPGEVAGAASAVERHRCLGARDPVHVVRFEDGGGLISYEHVDGFVHTLNTPEGMARKLAELGLGDAPGP